MECSGRAPCVRESRLSALIFCNILFRYCAQAVYLYNHPPVDMHPNLFIALIVVLSIAYYIFDTANSQKNRFRMMMSGTYIPRSTFPQLPWGTIANPKYVLRFLQGINVTLSPDT